MVSVMSTQWGHFICISHFMIEDWVKNLIKGKGRQSYRLR